MKRILIPADFSELADYAYNMAHVLYDESDLEIHVLSVITLTPDILFDEKGELVDEGVLDIHALDTMKREVSETMDKWLSGKKNIVESKAKLGRLTHDIINYVKENQIDLVIMGTSGAQGFKEIISGSHTSYLAMRCPVPVLSVKTDKQGLQVKNLVLAGDFRNPQMVNLSILKDIMNREKAQIHLVKINTPGDFETNETIESRMREFVEINELDDAHFHVYCDYNVEKGIETFSKEKNMDIIAIGTQQRTGLSRLVKRSIAYDIINHIQLPIVSFPMD